MIDENHEYYTDNDSVKNNYNNKDNDSDYDNKNNNNNDNDKESHNNNKNTKKMRTATLLRTCLSKKGGLHSEGSVWPVELNSSKLWRLQISAISMREEDKDHDMDEKEDKGMERG